jgi:hypothetical protein
MHDDVGVNGCPCVIPKRVGFSIKIDEICMPVAIGELGQLPAFIIDGSIS